MSGDKSNWSAHKRDFLCKGPSAWLLWCVPWIAFAFGFIVQPGFTTVLCTTSLAVVTGAWPGLGRAVAARLHERGVSVAVNVRNHERAEALAKEIGERAFAVPGDVAADGVPDEIARRTLERFGRIDILVNNAALSLSTRFPDLSAEEWRRAMEVNLTAPFLMTKTVLPAMRAQHYGRIINISSSAGRMVSPLGGAHYTASKPQLLWLPRAAPKDPANF